MPLHAGQLAREAGLDFRYLQREDQAFAVLLQQYAFQSRGRPQLQRRGRCRA